MLIRVIDFETCGLPPDNCQVVEVATLDLFSFGGDQWGRGGCWSSLVNPQRDIPPEMSAIHHITDAMVSDAPLLRDLEAGIRNDFTADDLWCSHNSRFDQAVAPWLGGRWIDTYRCALAAWPEAPSHSNQALRYWLGLTFAIDPGAPHRAAGDVAVTGAILRRLLQLYPLDTLLAASSQPALLPRFRFGKHKGVPIAQVPTDYLEWLARNPSTDVSAIDAEDVQFTVAAQLDARRAAQRARSPV